MLARYDFTSGNAGPRLLLLGGVHGDEFCGVAALARLRLELEQGVLPLRQGSVTIMPLCNPAAYPLNQRFVTHNLNRIINRYAAPTCAEEGFADQIAQAIEQADIILDLHSYSSGHDPFAFLDKPSADNITMARALGLNYWITGWDTLYGQPELNDDPTDSIQYAYRKGKTGILVECGQHTDPASVATAYRCARRTLALYGVCDGDNIAPPAPQVIRVDRIVHRDKQGHFVKDWQNFDPVREGSPLIAYTDGTQLNAPYDGLVILPNATAADGNEWLYLGRKE